MYTCKCCAGTQRLFCVYQNLSNDLLECSNNGQLNTFFFCSQEAFGFIERGDVVKEIFFHYSEFKGDLETLQPGDDVEFTIKDRNVRRNPVKRKQRSWGITAQLSAFPALKKGGGGSLRFIGKCLLLSLFFWMFDWFCALRVKKLQQMLDCCLKELSFLKISALNILKEL